MDIRSVGIIGTGVMGTDVARLCAARGVTTTLVKWTAGSVADKQSAFRQALGKDVERGRLTAAEAEAVLANLRFTGAPVELADCDLVIESIVEEIDAKRHCFAELDRFAKPGAVFATNTSTFSVAEIAEATRRPERFIGMHFFNPVATMELVEIPAPAGVAAEATAAARAFAARLGKQAFVVKDAPGFVVNRLLMSSPLEAVRMAFEERPPVASMETIDACVRLGLRHQLGPFQLMDLIGIDVMDAMAYSLQLGLRREAFAPPRLLDRMVEEGWLGRKSGLGFYDYSDRKNPRPNPDLERLASEP